MGDGIGLFPFYHCRHRSGVGQVAAMDRRGFTGEQLQEPFTGGGKIQPRDLHALDGPEIMGKMAAREPGDAGDEDLHGNSVK